MDYIYGREEMWELPTATPLGYSHFDYTTGARRRKEYVLVEVSSPTCWIIWSPISRKCESFRCGRDIFAKPDCRPLCGVADSSGSSLWMPIRTALEEVKRCYSKFGIETVLARVGRLIDTRLGLGQFDLIYSLGLFDYLPQRLGQRIVARLFDMLRPGGRVVVANFLPSVRDIGYMEAFMDWNLIYRTRQEMIDLIDELPQSKIKNVQLFAEENQNIIFVMVTRS